MSRKWDANRVRAMIAIRLPPVRFQSFSDPFVQQPRVKRKASARTRLDAFLRGLDGGTAAARDCYSPAASSASASAAAA
jgi:hypothetical protein